MSKDFSLVESYVVIANVFVSLQLFHCQKDDDSSQLESWNGNYLSV